MCLWVIAGTAGAGKTSLAVHWAHRVKDRFPGGQLYVNLRGYDPGEPVSAQEALHGFLAALGVSTAAIPADTGAAAAMFRSVLADRRMLIVLDNAATTTQVRPLLPGSDRCLVLVTSRSRLSALAVRDGAQRLTLGTLPEAEAIALLRLVTADYRPDDDTEELAELARLCARLPLALRIAAERAASHPHMRLTELIADLRDESGLWEALSTGEPEEAEAVRTVFAWSYRALPAEAARLFRLLGVHPGPQISLPAVGAAAGLSERQARQVADVLVGAHLLEQIGPGRFEFHDLLRAFAADRCREEEAEEDRAAALRRVLDWYLHTADAVQTWIEPTRDRVPLEPADDTVVPLSFTDYDEAVDWAEREHVNFLPVVRAADKAGLDRYTWRLAAVLWSAQAPSAVVTDWLAIGELGLAAVRRIGDQRAEAGLLTSLGFGYRRVNRLAESLRHHRSSLAIRQAAGDVRGQASSLNALGLVHLRMRKLADAEARLEEAAAIFRELGAPYSEAVALSNLASARIQAGRPDEAADAIQQALTTLRADGDKSGIGNALRILSTLHLERGELDEALRTAEEAVDLALDLRDHVLEGYWLLALADAQLALSRPGDALASYQRSASLHRRLGDRSREALAWDGAGRTYHRMGREEEAAAFHQQAAAAHRELGDAWNQALALVGLAAALDGSDPERARRHRGGALDLLGEYGDPRAERVRRRIRERM